MRFSALALVLLLATESIESFCVSLPAQELARASAIAAQARQRKIDLLRQRRVPAWAIDCAADLLIAQENWHAARKNPATRTQITEADELCALDAELDLLLTATLALNEDGTSITGLISAYYGEQEDPAYRQFRTPATPLLAAQAYRLTASQLFDPRPGQLGDVVPDRMALFRLANEAYVKGAQILKASRGDISASIPAKATLAAWITNGVPKISLNDLNNVQQLPAFHAVDFYKKYVSTEARLYADLGQLVLRETGAAGAKGGGATALAWLGAGRILFTARLLDADDITLRTDAHELEKQIQWIQEGKGFNGADFYHFQPYSRQTYITAALRDLNRSIDELSRLKTGEVQRVAAQQTWLGNLQSNHASRALLQQAWKTQARIQLQAELLELNRYLEAQDRQMLELALHESRDELNSFVQQFAVDLDASRYTFELALLRTQFLTDFLDMVEQLARHSGVSDLKEGGVADLSDFKIVDDFVNRLSPGMGDSASSAAPGQSARGGQSIEPLIKSAWNEALTSPGRGRTTLDVLQGEARVASLERERADDRLLLFDHKIEYANLQAEVKAYRNSKEEDNKNVADLWDAFAREKDEMLARAGEKRLGDTIIPRLRAQVQDVATRGHQATQALQRVQQQLKELQAIVNDIKAFRQGLDDAYSKAVDVISAARKIPVTITAGLTTGTSFDVGGSIADAARICIDRLDNFLQGKIQAQQLDEAIQKAQARVDSYLDKAQAVENELRAQQSKLQEGSWQLQDLQQTGALRKQYQERENAIKADMTRLDANIQAKEAQLSELQKTTISDERRDLANLANQAREREKIARTRVAGAFLQRGQRLQLLRAQIERIRQRDEEAQSAGKLLDRYRIVLANKAKQLDQAKKDLNTEGQQKLAALKKEVDARITAIKAQLVDLDAPLKRLLVPSLIEQIAPALALAAGREDSAVVTEEMNRANTLVEAAARSLYVLGDLDADSLAAPCRSLSELKLAAKDLQDRWRALRQRYAQSHHKVVVLRFSGEEIKNYAKGKRLVFRTTTNWPAVTGLTKPQRAPKESPFSLPDRAVWIYTSPSVVGGVPTFYLTRSAAESGGAGILAGGWLICHGKAGNGNQVELTDPYVIPRLYREGPIKVRHQGKLVTLDMKVDPTLGKQLLTQDDFSRIDNYKQFFNGLPASNVDFLEQPDAAQGHSQCFWGIGLDTLLVLDFTQFTSEKGSAVAPSALNPALDSVEIVLTYLAPIDGLAPEKSHGPDLAFLNTLTPPATIVPVPLTTEHIVASVAPTLALDDPQHATANGLVVLQPIDIKHAVREASALYAKVRQSLEKDFAVPLEQAVKTLKDVQKPITKVEQFKDAIASRNGRFLRMEKYVATLERAIGRLQSNELNPDEVALLQTLLGPDLNDVHQSWKRKLAARVNSLPVKGDIIVEVLNQLQVLIGSGQQPTPRVPTP